ncbi:RICIN domain-containing protein [Streptomyces sp. NPDC002324]
MRLETGPATSGCHRVVNVANSWCADAKYASTADGAAIIRWPDTGGTSQEWQLIALNDENANVVEERHY